MNSERGVVAGPCEAIRDHAMVKIAGAAMAWVAMVEIAVWRWWQQCPTAGGGNGGSDGGGGVDRGDSGVDDCEFGSVIAVVAATLRVAVLVQLC